MKIFTLSILACFIFLISCDDLLTKELPLEDVGFEPLLVLNSTVSNEEEAITISISRNISLAQVEPSQLELINDASIQLFVDEEMVPIQPIENPIFFNFIFENLDRINLVDKQIRVEVSHPDFPAAEAMTVVPQSANVRDITLDRASGTVPFETENYDELQFNVVDGGDQKDYYSVKLQSVVVVDTFFNGMDTLINSFEIFLDTYTSDPSFQEANGTLYFSDEAFNGSEYPVRILVEPLNTGQPINFAVSKISEEEYLFQTSLQRVKNSQDVGFFSEPSTLFTNVQGGLGILKSFNREFYEAK